jgi:hypothetical protein
VTRMLPTRLLPGTVVDGEADVFNRLINDPTTNDWTAIHSLHLPEHSTQREGEADFVVFVPGRGIVVVEIKSHRSLEIKNGEWLYSGSTTPGKNPFKQAHDNMWSNISLLKNHKSSPNTFKHIVWTYMVIFPNLSQPFEVKSTEWREEQVVDSYMLGQKPISHYILNALEKEHDHLIKIKDFHYIPKNFSPTIKEVDTMIKILKPQADLTESPLLRSQRILKEIKTLNPAQSVVLEASELNKRLFTSGPAGTGKTMLALEIAEKKASLDKNVLFLCFNQFLAEDLKQVSTNFKVQTFHSFLLEITGLNVPKENLNSFFNEELIEAAFDKIIEKNIKFDTLVIDEFQDLAIPEYLMLLDRLLHSGLVGGEWYIFADFEMQNLYKQKNSKYENLISLIDHAPLELKLRINCRNTPSVSKAAEELGKMNPPYLSTLRLEGNVPVMISTYKSTESQIENVLDTVDLLKLKGYEENEIIFLYSSDTGLIDTLKEKFNLKIDKYEPNKKAKRYTHTSIQSFKGLEHNIVILLDVEPYGKLESKDLTDLLYTGITRSLETTIVNISVDEYKSRL